MSKITSEILQKVAPGTPKAKRDRFLSDFNSVLPKYGITTKDRVAAFLTTVCFESDYFKALAEYADGWAYDISRNRKKALELGNTQKGDGPKYKGAGGIETTGKANYRRLSDRLGVDFVANPNLLRTEKYFVEAACVFWDDNHFNELADHDEITLIENITNRGSGNKTAKALSDRLKIYRNLMSILPDDFKLSGKDDTVKAPSEPEVTKDVVAPTQLEDSSSQDSNVNQEVNVSGDNSSVVVPTPQPVPLPDAQPITIKGVTTSIWTKIVATITALAGLGINTGTVIENKLEDISLHQIIVIAMGAGLVVLAVWYFKKRQEAADKHNMQLVAVAADTTKNTVHVER